MQKGISLILVLTVLAVLAIFAGAGFYIYQNYSKSKVNSKITDFESCAKAGNPVTASYPGQCHTSDGRIFVQPLSEEEKKRLLPPQVP